MSLLQKLLKIRQSVDYIQKTEQGNQGARYVDPAVLVKKIRARMDEEKILLVPKFGNAEVSQVSAPTKANSEATAFMIRSSFEYVWMDTESEDVLTVPWFITGKHATDPAMAEGSALTYNERYFLLKFFQIPTSKDDPEYFSQKTKEPPKISIGEDNLKWVAEFCKRHGISSKDDKSAFQAYYQFDPFKTTSGEFEAIKAQIQGDYNEV